MDSFKHMWIALTKDMRPVIKYTLGFLIYGSVVLLFPIVVLFILFIAIIEVILFQIGNSIKPLIYKNKEG